MVTYEKLDHDGGNDGKLYTLQKLDLKIQLKKAIQRPKVAI
jgi:hypothetical protein